MKAGPGIRAARRHGSDNPAAARALGLVLTHDATVLARAPAVLARIETGMASAQRTVVLHEFNHEFNQEFKEICLDRHFLEF